MNQNVFELLNEESDNRLSEENNNKTVSKTEDIKPIQKEPIKLNNTNGTQLELVGVINTDGTQENKNVQKEESNIQKTRFKTFNITNETKEWNHVFTNKRKDTFQHNGTHNSNNYIKRENNNKYNETNNMHPISNYKSEQNQGRVANVSEQGSQTRRELVGVNNMKEQFSEVKRKSFSSHVSRQENVHLPEYYQKRTGINEFEIPQCEYEWVKHIGGLEKSGSMDHTLKGLMAFAIAYNDNKTYMTKNKFFSGKLSVVEEEQDNLIELICMQATAIFFHRLIKSDSVDIEKIILKNLPLYRAVHGNPTEVQNTHSESIRAYMRVRNKFINNLRISQKKVNTEYSEEDIRIASQKVNETEKKWLNYVLQSIWNGNNPIHDCLYYGANASFAYLLSYYFENGMQSQLNHMMIVSNIQNESHYDILQNGKKACESQSSYIIRKKQFDDCERLYKKTIDTLRNQIKKIVEDEIKIIPNENNIEQTTHIDLQKINQADDNINIRDLITSGNVEGMISHIKRCAASNNVEIIKKTLELWKIIVDSDGTGQYSDYLEDVKFQTNDLLNNKFQIN